ncbi:hypothetical protein L7F22_006207 [Adiantum nelumboides]|nr:hypothetical protein [Adiantum nelumboides]
MGNPKPSDSGNGDAGFRSVDRSSRHCLLILCPMLLTALFCISWATCPSLLPLPAPLLEDCAPHNNVINSACNALFRHRRAINVLRTMQNAFSVSVANQGLKVLNKRQSVVEEGWHVVSLVPSRHTLSHVISVEGTGDDRQQDNPSTIRTVLPPLTMDPQKNVSNKEASGSCCQTPVKTEVEDAERIMKDLRRAVDSLHMQSKLDTVSFDPKSESECERKRIFIYDLPKKFNVHLLARCLELIPWQNMCDFLSNSGMGRILDPSQSEEASKVLVPSGLWYETHQYALEVLFHERLKNYKCLTTSSEAANVFYIPYYGGLDVLQWHFSQNVSAVKIDKLGLELINWLKEQPTWRKNEGLDHVLVLGKITWDFRRVPFGKLWGSSLLLQDEMQNLTKLLIERQPWHENEVGVPHPTFFHPRHDRDIRAWQDHIASVRRTHLVSFAGEPRPQQPESIRSHLIRQCTSSIDMVTSSLDSACYFMNCSRGRCLHPNTTMDVFIHSEFCMQPPGDSPTRRSIFDSLIAGCVPVLFDPYSAYYQYPWHLPRERESYSVYIPAEDVRNGTVNVIDELRKIPESVRREMRRRIIYDIMPGLVYARPDARLKETDDAFLVSLRGLFARVSERLVNARRGK